LALGLYVYAEMFLVEQVLCDEYYTDVPMMTKFGKEMSLE